MYAYNTETPKRARLSILIFAGVALGLVSILSPGLIFDITLACAIFYAISSLRDKDDKEFVRNIFIAGLVLRVILLVMVQMTLVFKGSWTDFFGYKTLFLFGDDGYYTARSWWMAQYFSGKHLTPEVFQSAFGVYNYTGYLHLMAVFHYLFGFSPISAIFVNCILSVSTAIIYYFLAKRVADVKTARMTAFFMMFFPSLIIWSIVNLKDSLFILLTGVFLFYFFKALDENKPALLFFSVGALFIQNIIRLKFLVITLVVTIIMAVCYLTAKRKIKLIHVIIILCLCLPFHSQISKYAGVFRKTVATYHVGVISVGGFTYKIFDSWVYEPNPDLGNLSNKDMAKALPKALTHFFLEPFPWKMRSGLSIVSLPQMIPWYIFILSAILGMVVQLRRDWRRNMIFPLYLIFMGIILSLTGGNIGTDFRIRDVLTPIIILLASSGISRFITIKFRR